ncbi:hypothetical protein ACFOY4_24320 [Actinomadura syzygii]|uniref:WXG100 family type VII secretion target n=1 Tax=Actinomadura syzygii TaxID=1427538 RepID=A0A5D0UKF8_9ACTN|nr:hypothetical protein [Actinomadura syzygii]TYC18447.1 hypothetical protein FXF65_01405 [Actinomadura syzygii]
MTEINLEPGFYQGNAYPESVKFAIDFTGQLGIKQVGDLVHKMWGNPAKLDHAAESWSYLAQHVLASTQGELEKKAAIFDGGGWEGPARSSYDKWINRFGLRVGVPMSGRASEMSGVMSDLAKHLRSVRSQIIWLCGEFVAAVGGGAYLNKKGGGLHAKSPSAPYEGKHAGGKAGKGGALILLAILYIVWDFVKKLQSLFDKLTGDMAAFKARIYKAREKVLVYPASPVTLMANPNRWSK